LEARNLLTFFGGYRTVDELYADLQTIAATYPQITELVTYGQSYSETVGGVTTPGNDFLPGYDLLALHISNQAVPEPKPVFVLSSGMHSREISGPEVTMRFVDWLTQGYGNDADATWLVDQEDIWVVPVVNPDGHWYVELGTQPPYNGNPWLWRKNGDPSYGSPIWPPSQSGYGVDLNRNFDDHWGGIGSSSDPYDETYRGPFVNSEPESAALQNLIGSLIPVQKGPDDNDPAPDDTTGIYIDVHTYGGYVLWPWGHTSTPTPNSVGLSAIGRKFATYNHYTAGQSYQTLYPTTGVAPFWAYGHLGIPAYTFELNSAGFLAPYSSVDSTLWPQNEGAFIYAAKIARTPYITVHGPDALAVATQLNGSELTVTGQINDSQNGNQNVVAAEFYIDTPPWADGAQAIPMEASDGDFDSPIENVDGMQPTDGLDPGQHIVYVRGLEANGYWGPVSAAFFDLAPPPSPGRGGQFGLENATALVGGLNEPHADRLSARLPGDPGFAPAFVSGGTGRAGEYVPTLTELVLVTSPARRDESSSTGRTDASWFVPGSQSTEPHFAAVYGNLDDVLAAFAQATSPGASTA
jgi:hypothetical protein